MTQCVAQPGLTSASLFMSSIMNVLVQWPFVVLQQKSTLHKNTTTVFESSLIPILKETCKTVYRTVNSKDINDSFHYNLAIRGGSVYKTLKSNIKMFDIITA